MRLLKKLYHDVLTTLQPIAGSHKEVAEAIVSAEAVSKWLEGKEATEIGVPRACVLKADGTDTSGNQFDDSYDDGNDGPQFGQRRQKGSKRSKKSAGRSEDECFQKFQTIMYSCKKYPEKRESFYDSMCEWHEADGRSSVHSGAGAPESTRTRGPADTPKGVL